jgi:23S rRNA pseudouridine2605 synthase
MSTERLHKILARHGVASRREAERMIAAGRVAVNGEVVTEAGANADAANDYITIDGNDLPDAQSFQYFALYKPRDVVSTMKDPEGRPCIADFLPDDVRLVGAGRLDYDSEGLMIVSNDGELIHALTHPTSKVEKVYEVKVDGEVRDEHLAQLRQGVMLDDGHSGAADVRFLRFTPKNAWLRIALSTGRNRIIRRICEAVGIEVQRLRRIGMAGFELGEMHPGELRPLKPKEVARLWAAINSGGRIADLPGERTMLPGRLTVAKPRKAGTRAEGETKRPQRGALRAEAGKRVSSVKKLAAADQLAVAGKAPAKTTGKAAAKSVELAPKPPRVAKRADPYAEAPTASPKAAARPVRKAPGLKAASEASSPARPARKAPGLAPPVGEGARPPKRATRSAAAAGRQAEKLARIAGNTQPKKPGGRSAAKPAEVKPPRAAPAPRAAAPRGLTTKRMPRVRPR